MRLSFIIPVYNVEHWFGRCLESIVAQELAADDYEVVIVDDGSTDDSMDVLARFRDAQETAGRTVRWQVIRQENRGLSAARNAGLEVAQGDYVWWVDSDDYLEPRMADALLGRAEREQLDVLCFGLQLAGEDGTFESYPIADRSQGQVLSGEEFLVRVAMPPSAWAAIYRRQFLVDHGLTYLVGALHEDQDFTPRAYFLARRIAYQPVVVYNYVQRAGSILRKHTPKRTTDLVQICTRLYHFAQEHTQPGTPAREVFENRIAFLFSQALSNLARCGIAEFPMDVRQLPFYPLRINDSESKKLRYKYRLINMGVPLYIKLYSKFANKPEQKPGLRRLRTK